MTLIFPSQCVLPERQVDAGFSSIFPDQSSPETVFVVATCFQLPFSGVSNQVEGGISRTETFKTRGCSVATSDQVGRDPLAEKVGAWWLEVLSGEKGRDHPIYGANVHARLRGDTLTVAGSVDSSSAQDALKKEILTLNEGGIRRVRFKVEVAKLPGDRGVLKQAIMAFYTNPEQASMAQRYLEGHPGVRPSRTDLLDEQSVAGALGPVAEDWKRQLADGFRKGKSLLLGEVDEVEAFRATELLDETKSLEILVLPPVV